MIPVYSGYSKLTTRFGYNSRILEAIKWHYKICKDAISDGQLNSKLWLLDRIKGIDLGTVFICAGWYGILATMMFEDENIYVDKIRSFDLDDNCWKIAEDFNRPWTKDNWKFKASTLDITTMQFPTKHKTYRANGTSLILDEMPDTIINTSCEHIENFTDWVNLIPSGKLVALQSNNYFELPEHVNCVNDIDEFKQQAPLSNIIYEGELELEKYTRYMIIGYK